MKQIPISLLLLLAVATPAHADPVSIGIGIQAAATWWGTLNVVAQFAIQVGVTLALSAASYGISYLLSSGGQRQAQAQADNLGVQVEELNGTLERRRIYGPHAAAGGVFFAKAGK